MNSKLVANHLEACGIQYRGPNCYAWQPEGYIRPLVWESRRYAAQRLRGWREFCEAAEWNPELTPSENRVRDAQKALAMMPPGYFA